LPPADMMAAADGRDRALPATGGAAARPTNPFPGFEKGEVDGSIGCRFESRVRLHPERPALRKGALQVTYAALNRGADLLARAVAEAGEGTESPAAVLCDRELSQTRNRLLGGVFRTNTDGCHLCQSEGFTEFMETDSEALMREGIALARETFEQFLGCVEWERDTIAKTFCHQVGRAHHRLMLEALALDPAIDFPTFDWLGNTGSVALPTSAALGVECGRLQRGDRVGLLGIGSGINVVMLAVEWQRSLTMTEPSDPASHSCELQEAEL